ncbi:MAG: AraC family transcriptional regulator [Deltaproteobacteria bacterium]|nr:AraC family transcriptional regulator [Deltaproteobacteria bacterium]
MMPMNFFFILIVATITLGTLLVFALLTSKHRYKTANYLLSGLIVLFSYYAIVKILSNTNGILYYPHLIRTYRPIFILACAVIYFYCKALTTPGFRFTYIDSLHLVPFGMYTLIMLPFFFSDPATKVASLSLQPFTLSWMIERSFWVIVFFFYLGFSYRTIRQHQQRIKDIFSNLEKVKLHWLRNLLLAFGVIWVTALIRFLTAYGKVGYENKFLVPILLCLTIFLIGWYALRQPEIFSDRWDKLIRENDRKSVAVVSNGKNRHQEPAGFKQPPKYEYSSLSEQDIARHKDNLIKYLKQENPYTDPDLQLQNLADHMGIPSYQVSQIINTELQQNFYDLINSLRIAEAKNQLVNPDNQHLTILDIAYDVGFNSKSTFNTAFKKYTKMTPSQFRKSQLPMAVT